MDLRLKGRVLERRHGRRRRARRCVAGAEDVKEDRPLVGGELDGPSTCHKRSATTNCTNVWGRALRSGGEIAIAFVNNAPESRSVACDAACFGRLDGMEASSSSKGYSVRDLWSHTQLPEPIALNLSALVPGNGGVRLFRLKPLKSDD